MEFRYYEEISSDGEAFIIRNMTEHTLWFAFPNVNKPLIKVPANDIVEFEFTKPWIENPTPEYDIARYYYKCLQENKVECLEICIERS